MSHNPWSRPVRLLQPQQYTLAPIAPALRPASSVERFRRSVGSPRQAEGAAPLAQPREPGAAPGVATEAGARWSDEGREPPPPITPMPELGPEPDRTGTPASPPRRAQLATPPPFAADQPQAFGAGTSAGTADAWPHSMAHFVEALCARADAAFRSWSATIALDAQALPGTELQLHLSPHWLRLRFSTQSASSAALISRHRARLISLLEEAPSLPQGIDVDIA